MLSSGPQHVLPSTVVHPSARVEVSCGLTRDKQLQSRRVGFGIRLEGKQEASLPACSLAQLSANTSRFPCTSQSGQTAAPYMQDAHIGFFSLPTTEEWLPPQRHPSHNPPCTVTITTNPVHPALFRLFILPHAEETEMLGGFKSLL